MIGSLLKKLFIVAIPLLGARFIYKNQPLIKGIIFDGLFFYCKMEAKVKDIFKYINYTYTVRFGYDIFYYDDGVCIYKDNIKNIHNLNSPLDYDYIICKRVNLDKEEMSRLFECQEQLLCEYKQNNDIKFKHCELSLINAKITFLYKNTNGEDRNISYNVTPLKTSYCSGNVLFSKNYMKHFFNMELTENYTINIMDKNLNSIILKEKEQIELWDENFTILETVNIPKSENEKESLI